MPCNVLIVPDKFKGTLNASGAARAIARGWKRQRPHDRLELVSMSDGGDGFGELLSLQVGARAQTIKAVDASHRPCRSTWWWEPGTRMAIIESAKVIGLAMLPPGRSHPFELDTFGLGKVIKAASRKGARTCIVGIGGSATNDGGFGMAQALGWQFLDSDGRRIESWTGLNRLHHIEPPQCHRLFPRLTVAVDVQNRLLGPKGCSRIYGPQKGLRSQDFPIAEAALGQLARVIRRDFKRDFAAQPGSGAAGGLGFGLMAFLGAQMAPGFGLFARHARLAQRIRKADLVLTGEGAIDQSTMMGKGVGELAQLCRRVGVPCLGLAGSIVGPLTIGKLFARAYGLTQITTLENAKAKTAFWLERLAGQAAAAWADR
jgi:glycerate 2-kinase